ncbi:RICIN domain-containing protein [Actinokineospora sp. HUAS TT18]|uniref:RICIN domain-containing protein n=1 Tax=Actinokineospora sp. HUAS TT18 TaxID=3447451 RepID=UPI003F51DDD2
MKHQRTWRLGTALSLTLGLFPLVGVGTAHAAPTTSCDAAAASYSAVRSIDLPLDANWLDVNPPYSYEGLGPVAGGFDRVGYCLELVTTAGTNWVWTAFAPQSGDQALLGLPTRRAQAFRGPVTELTVASNVGGVVTGSGRTGYLEMWPHTYAAVSARQVPGSSAARFDADDSPVAESASYGSFQVSDRATATPLLSVNRFTRPDSTPLDVGIGARATGEPDWTFAANAGSYTTRRLTVFARPAQLAVTTAPKPGQLFPRDLATNRATVAVSGRTTTAAVTSVELEVWRSGTRTDLLTTPTTGTGAAFSFSPQITAGLADHHVKLFAVSAAGRRLVGSYTDVVAGDTYFVTGQSNAEARSFAGSSAADESHWVRAFGSATHDPTLSTADRSWHQGVGDIYVQSGAIGQWATRMAKRIVDTYQVPVAIIQGAHSGMPISFFQRDDNNTVNPATNYGRAKARLTAAGVAGKIRGILYYQGESEGGNAVTHTAGFTALHQDWRADFGGQPKVYVHQVRASGCGQLGLDLREAQRQLRHSLGVTLLSTTGVTQTSDNCHFPYIGGYQPLGDHDFAVLAKDLYGGPSAGVDAPDPASATIDPTGTRVTVQLRNTTDTLTVAPGVQQHFSLDGSTASVTAVTALSGGRLQLDLSAPATGATGVTYAVLAPNPPWITNASGTGLLVFKNVPLIVSGSSYLLTNRASGKSAAAPNQSSGAQLVQLTTDSSANQRWVATLNADGTYTLTNAFSGLCVDVTGASGNPGATIIQWTCHGGANQRWWITAGVGGGHTLTSAASRLAVTGDPLTQQQDTDAATQRWTLTKI